VVTTPISQDSVLKAIKSIAKSREWLENTEELLDSLIRRLRAIVNSWYDFEEDGWVNVPRSNGIQSLQQQIVNKVKELTDVLNGFLDLKGQCHQFRQKVSVFNVPIRALPPASVSQDLKFPASRCGEDFL
jgi:hypothetical protein